VQVVLSKSTRAGNKRGACSPAKDSPSKGRTHLDKRAALAPDVGRLVFEGDDGSEDMGDDGIVFGEGLGEKVSSIGTGNELGGAVSRGDVPVLRDAMGSGDPRVRGYFSHPFHVYLYCCTSIAWICFSLVPFALFFHSLECSIRSPPPTPPPPRFPHRCSTWKARQVLLCWVSARGSFWVVRRVVQQLGKREM
jgi:hypothetical protein